MPSRAKDVNSSEMQAEASSVNSDVAGDTVTSSATKRNLRTKPDAIRVGLITASATIIAALLVTATNIGLNISNNEKSSSIASSGTQDVETLTKLTESQNIEFLNSEKKGILAAKSRLMQKPLDAFTKANISVIYDKTLELIDERKDNVRNQYKDLYPQISNKNLFQTTVIKDQIKDTVYKTKITIEQVYRLANQNPVKIKRTQFKNSDAFQEGIAEMMINGRRASNFPLLTPVKYEVSRRNDESEQICDPEFEMSAEF